MQAIFKQLQLTGIVPVIKISEVSKAVPLAKALITGGLPCAEVTFRTAQAAEAIRAITAALPEMLVGAGTVLTREQADAAAAAGAKFIVSPGLNPDIVKHCQEKGLPILPGCCTPSEIEQALALGLRVVKFFPAEAAGGLEMVKALSAPYGDVLFVPTGGIGPSNLTDYLSFNKILACGGSWMVKEDLIAAGEFGRIADMTREAVNRMLGFSLASVYTDEGQAMSQWFGGLFYDYNGKENDANGAAEMSSGQLVIKTNFIERAAYYLKQRGAKITEKQDENGRLTDVLLQGTASGLNLRVVQR